MATLVFTAVGTLIGGPIGGLIGAVAGQAVDNQIFGSGSTRQGPRLGDLSVQVSRYGQQIPKLFGTMRVSGSVIWATDLREDSHTSGGGKSSPRTTTYSYSSSFAVALSARPIRAVHRIWADGKLLRGAAGDWKTSTGFRLHLGDEGQAADPLIASIEGVASTPAFRGIAYAVFENLQLADYGNRIPLLTFEVEADAAPVDAGAIAADLSDDAIAGTADRAIGGYAATGDSVRGAIDPLTQLLGLTLRDDGERLQITPRTSALLTIDPAEFGTTADEQRADRRAITQSAASALSDEVTVSYYDPSLDFQAGLQRARRKGVPQRSEQIELPAALAADAAKQVANARLADIWAGRTEANLTLPWRYAGLRPGDQLVLPGIAYRLQLNEISLEKMVVQARFVGTASGSGIIPPVSSGRPVQQVDQQAGVTRFEILDLPPLTETLLTTPRLWIAAAGTSPGWRSATFQLSLDGGSSFTTIGTAPAPAPAVIGNAASVLPDGDPALFDEANGIEIDLLHEDMLLEGRSDEAMLAGANLAMLGNELIQFGQVEVLGPRRFRLSRLLRGRRGTEWATNMHEAGERFVLIEQETLLTYDLPLSALGGSVQVIAQGLGDSDTVVQTAQIGGAALRPPAPCHITAQRLADGTMRFSWVRRSRAGWAWLDNVDAPLGEAEERYRLLIEPGAGSSRSITLTSPSYDYKPAQQAEDGSTLATEFSVTVAQIGTVAASSPPGTAHFIFAE